jgi:trans-aconitate methyltransferase
VKKLVVGIGFYKREQWHLLREAAVDSDILETTYDGWLEVLDSSVERIRTHGLEPELIDVDVEELMAFCKERRLPNTAGARAKFVAEQAGKKWKKTPGKA